MGSFFTGSPNVATSYTTSSTETPKWMQDAIYNQVQFAQNVANRPYEQYALPTTAELSPLQQQAYQQVQSNQGAWQPTMNTAMQGVYANASSGNTAAAAAQPWMQQAASLNGGTAAQPYINQQADLLGSIDYNQPANTLNPYVQQSLNTNGINAAQPWMQQAATLAQGAAGNTANQLRYDQATALNTTAMGAAQPYFNQASQGAAQAGGLNTAAGLNQAQNPYLNANLAGQNLAGGQSAFAQASGQNALNSAQPYLNQATNINALNSAQPYLNQAAQNSAQNIDQYMNPYMNNVTDRIAQLGARNLSENLLPAVSDQFVRAGGFGGSRMGEFGSRALRDTQDSVLGQQAQALQQGYGQALSASQSDLARQGQLAGTAGQLEGQRQSTLANIGQNAGQLSNQQTQNAINLGQAQTAAGQAQQQYGLQSAQNVQQAQTSDAARALAAAQQQAQIGQNSGQFQASQQGNMLNASQAAQAAAAGDMARQASVGNQLAGIGQTMGSLTNQQQQAIMQGGQALSSAQQQAISQGLQGAQQWGSTGSAMGGLTQAQQQMLANIGQTTGSLTNSDLARQLSGYGNLAGLSQQGQNMGYTDTAALEAAGSAQQQQLQNQYNAAYNQWQQQQLYPQQQLDWLNTQVRGMAPITPQITNSSSSGSGQSYSPSGLQQLASGLATYKGFTSN